MTLNTENTGSVCSRVLMSTRLDGSSSGGRGTFPDVSLSWRLSGPGAVSSPQGCAWGRQAFTWVLALNGSVQSYTRLVGGMDFFCHGIFCSLISTHF